jgi:hypothetical protein
VTPGSSLLAGEDRVRVNLEPAIWHTAGRFDGTIIRIDPYSARRSFCRVKLEVHVESARGRRTNLLAVLDPKHMVRI